jgi:hypothetical protein
VKLDAAAAEVSLPLGRRTRYLDEVVLLERLHQTR